RPDRAETSQRMPIGIEPQFQVFVPLIIPPDLGEPEEEPLLRRKPVDLRLRPLLRDRFLEREIRDLNAADIGNIFALGQLAVNIQSRQRFVTRILGHDGFRALDISLGRFRRPPIPQIPDRNVLPAATVESGRTLMAYD